MKKNKLLILCAILVAGTVSLTACGGNNDNGTEAPYEDETNKDVNDTNGSQNGTNNGNDANGTDNGTNNDMDVTPGDSTNGGAGSDLEDAGRNLMDSIKDTGDAIRDGVDNLGNGNNRTNP